MTPKITPLSFTIEERTQFSGPALRALIKLETNLGLTEIEMLKILGKPGKTEYKEWRRAAAAHETLVLPNETLNRIRTTIQIIQNLAKKWPKKPERVTEWLRTPHTAPIFQKKPPLNLIGEKNFSGIASVLRYTTTFNNSPDPQKASPKPIRRKQKNEK